MSETSTHDYSAREEEADYLLNLFERLPDALFKNNDLLPHEFVITKIKAFARSYHPIKVAGRPCGIVVN
ncbi:hypothetical protein [Carboxylicivirga taeanensis]|uniref:hypothetical protein n=1 Tax=Carboxylicivirga taeanensis TaxID=1416875 RepID=UPI003F6DA872